MKDIKKNSSHKLSVSLFNFEHGLSEYNGVAAVRVINVDHRFLFMSDYAPALGQVEGTVIVIKDDEEIKFENMRGFFVLKDNVFRLIQDDLSKMN